MDKNSIYGIILIVLIVLVFSYLQKPAAEKQVQQPMTDSIEQPVKNSLKEKNAAEKLSQVQKNDSTKQQDVLGEFTPLTAGQQQFYTLENDLMKVTLSGKGGRVYAVELKKYKNYKKQPVVLFHGDSTIFSFNFYTARNRHISTNDLYFIPAGSADHLYVHEKDSMKSFVMRLDIGKNKYIDYVYEMFPSSYKLNFRVIMSGMDSVLAPNTTTIDLKWEAYIPQQEKGRTNEDNYTSIYYKYYQDNVEAMPGSNKDQKIHKLDNRLKWIAFKQQFFSSVLISESYFENALLKSVKLNDDSVYLRVFSAEAAIGIKKSSTIVLPFTFYFGPNHYSTLKAMGNDLEELVQLGRNIVKWVNRFLIIPVFNFLNRFISNYGIIILILTIIIKLLLLPLTYSSYLSQAKMKVLKPQIDEINARIPAEKAMERQQALMNLYKKAGVNPLGGCIPMLLQLPILIAMFRFFPTSIELRQQSFLWAHDLSTYDAILEWNTYIPFISKFYGNHISLFTLLMTITTLITVRMNSQTTLSDNQMPGMKFMTYMMPIMFMFILNRFSAALTYYYFLVNLITIGQNELFKLMVNEEKLLARLNENKKKPVKKSKWQERIEQMAKNKGYQPRK